MLRVAGCGLRVAGCGLRVAGCGLRVAGYKENEKGRSILRPFDKSIPNFYIFISKTVHGKCQLLVNTAPYFVAL